MSSRASPHAHRAPFAPRCAPADDPLASRRRTVRRLAQLGVVLMIAVIALSAFLRLAQSGVGCEGWPGCYERTIREAGSTAPVHPIVAPARIAHRVVASTMLVCALMLGVATLAKRPRLAREGRMALGLIVLVLALATLGAVARGSTAPMVILGNLLGGFAMLALCARLASAAPAPSPALRRWARVGLALAAAEVALGGLVDARHAAAACGSWEQCARIALDAGWDAGVLDPRHAPDTGAIVAPYARGAWIQWLHRSGAVLLVPVLVAVTLVALRDRRHAAAATLVALLVAQLALGGLLASAGMPLPQVLAHNLAAALLVALLARLA